MRRVAKAVCIGAVAAAFASPALASGNGPNGIGVSGTATNTCTLSAPTLVASSDAVLNSSTPTTASVTISNFVNPANAQYVDGVSITLNFNGMCNYASKFQSQTTSGAMKNTTPVVAGSGPFISSLNYNALLQWASQNSVLNTDGTALKKGSLKSVAGAFSGTAQLSITLLDPSSTNPLLAGSFNDTLTVQIGAAL